MRKYRLLRLMEDFIQTDRNSSRQYIRMYNNQHSSVYAYDTPFAQRCSSYALAKRLIIFGKPIGHPSLKECFQHSTDPYTWPRWTMPSLKHSLRRTYPVLRVSNSRFRGKIPYPKIEQQPDSLTLTDSVPSDLHRTRLLHMPMRLDVGVVVH